MECNVILKLQIMKQMFWYNLKTWKDQEAQIESIENIIGIPEIDKNIWGLQNTRPNIWGPQNMRLDI